MISKQEQVQPEETTVTEVFRENEYVIPIYQRNYAWGKDEIEQLLNDIQDSKGKYYLGSLIVNQLSAKQYEVIDGQQRLTTLFLLLSWLSDDSVRSSSLRFEAREKSNKTLVDLQDKEKSIRPAPWYSEEILSGYGIIGSFFENKDQVYKDSFIKKLPNIKIIRIQVPQDIDLNHYFEIMNTRGEQLELHEIAKERLMEAIKTDMDTVTEEDERDRTIVSEIWDACAKMDKYVQMNFGTTIREKVFGSEWSEFNYNGFDELRTRFDKVEADTEQTFTLVEKLKDPVKESSKKKESDDSESERFDSIISFPNFILQVNEAMSLSDADDDSGLDDKRFIDTLQHNWASKEDALNFAFHLLKCRYLFDKYIIKREFAKNYKLEGKWSLQRMEKYVDNQKRKKAGYKGTYNTGEDDSGNTSILRLLQSCLRITYTSPKTMHWISKALHALLNDETADITYLLESYCCQKVIDSDFKNRKGFGIDRIVFTFLDYLLCRDNPLEFVNYQFQFRTSIEHFYPQHPVNGQYWAEEDLNNFGNLALITVSANSKFSNMLPRSKDENYGEIIQQSPKLIRMKKMMDENNGVWTKQVVTDHCAAMMDLLEQEIQKKAKLLEDDIPIP